MVVTFLGRTAVKHDTLHTKGLNDAGVRGEITKIMKRVASGWRVSKLMS